MDSTVLLYDLVSQDVRPHCLLFDYKQRHAQELTFAKFHCSRLGAMLTTIELPMLRGSSLTDGVGSVVVPFRNPIMLSLAVNFAASIGAESQNQASQLWRLFIRYRRQMDFPDKQRLLTVAEKLAAPDFRKERAKDLKSRDERAKYDAAMGLNPINPSPLNPIIFVRDGKIIP